MKKKKKKGVTREALTCAMNFLSSEADVEGVRWISSAGQLHTELRRRHTGELACCLAEVGVF